jgi:hypothetical protein
MLFFFLRLVERVGLSGEGDQKEDIQVLLEQGLSSLDMILSTAAVALWGRLLLATLHAVW